MDQECLENGLYSAREIRSILARLRQIPLPERTFRYWKQRLGIKPNEYGKYTQKDLDVLKGLVKWLRNDGIIDQYKDFIEGKIDAN